MPSHRRPRTRSALWEALSQDLQEKILDAFPLQPHGIVRPRAVCKQFAARLQPHFELYQFHSPERFVRYTMELVRTTPKLSAELYLIIHWNCYEMIDLKKVHARFGTTNDGFVLNHLMQHVAESICSTAHAVLDAQMHTLAPDQAERLLRIASHVFAPADARQPKSARRLSVRLKEHTA